MKSIRRNLGLALLTMLIFGIAYPLAMVGLAGIIAPEASEGKPIWKNEKLVGFENVGQTFNSSIYFWSRPSAVNYDAAGTGGSNLGPTNPDLLQMVKSRIDTLLASHPGLKKNEIPVELVTASGSGLDPHISREAALIQVGRIARTRNVAPEKLEELIEEQTEQPLLGLFGPGNYVNVLKLNLALDQLAESSSN